MNYEIINSEKGLIKTWTKGVAFEEEAKEQLKNISNMPFVYKWVAAMPDVHLGRGATVGSVIPTIGAIIPAAVGVDIGCGMMAVKTSLTSNDMPESLSKLRSKIEEKIPVGFSHHQKINNLSLDLLSSIEGIYKVITDRHPALIHKKYGLQMGTLGGGNHFVEVCLDTEDSVWIMLHSGSRGAGNLIGRYFIAKAKEDMKKYFINLPDQDLAYLPEGSENYDDYLLSVDWAQKYARANREVMMASALQALREEIEKPFTTEQAAINCHHNYITKENHYGKNIHVTRKGAVRARQGDLGIIPGSMGAKSFIVEGLGNDESFHSCSHGAGRMMSRRKAKELISVEDHVKSTEGVECKKDESVLDESPKAYKDIDSVMNAQSDLVRIKYTLKQILCVKG